MRVVVVRRELPRGRACGEPDSSAAPSEQHDGPGDHDTGETYYRHWLNALERLVAEKGVADAAALARYQHAWDHAADRTPHGQPIELSAAFKNDRREG